MKKKILFWLRSLGSSVGIGLIVLIALFFVGFSYFISMVSLKSETAVDHEKLRFMSHDLSNVLTDLSVEPFRSYIDQFQASSEQYEMGDIKRLVTDFSAKPGVKNVYWVAPDSILISAHSYANREWLAAYLWEKRMAFNSNPSRVGRQTDRIGFRSYLAKDERVYLMGMILPVKKKHTDYKKWMHDKANFGKFLIVEFDPQFFHQTIQNHMDAAISQYSIFYGWTYPEIVPYCGFGIINRQIPTDTIWWHGAKKFRATAEWHSMVQGTPAGGEWFDCQVYRSISNEEYTKRNFGTKALQFTLNAIAILTVVFLLILLMTYWNTRRLWLARETALDYLAHSLKTPISRIRLRGEILAQKRVESEEVEQATLHGIIDECDRMNRTVLNSLLIVRGEINHAKFSSVSLTELLDEIKNSWKPIFDSALIDFTVTNSLDNIHLRGNRELLVVLCDNLLDNAFRAIRKMRQSGSDSPMTVQVSLSEMSPNGIRLTFEDSGTGFDSKQLKRILKQHYLPGTSSESDPGIGIGMSLVKEIVQLHRGKIALSNRASGGAVVTIDFPLDLKK